MTDLNVVRVGGMFDGAVVELFAAKKKKKTFTARNLPV